MSEDDGGEKPAGEVLSLAERRRRRQAEEEPGVGWPQQDRFLQLIDDIDDENDRLVKFLRALRMAVAYPHVFGFTEEMWETVLMCGEAVVRMEQHVASKESEDASPSD